MSDNNYWIRGSMWIGCVCQKRKVKINSVIDDDIHRYIAV